MAQSIQPIQATRRLLLAGALASLAGSTMAAMDGKADGEPAIKPSTTPTPADLVTDTLTVSGTVEHNLKLSVADLRTFRLQPAVRVSLGHGASNKSGWKVSVKGILLTDILDRATVVTHNHNDVKKTVIVATASDGYKVVFSWSELFNSPLGDGVLVYFEKDGKPLGDDEGRIAMISTKDTHTGPRHVKWLNGIEVRKIVD